MRNTEVGAERGTPSEAHLTCNGRRCQTAAHRGTRLQMSSASGVRLADDLAHEVNECPLVCRARRLQLDVLDRRADERGAKASGRDVLREQAQRRVENVPVASVVVMGHTHLTDDYPLEHGHYLNPGSWTRYLDIETHPNLRLDELKDETQYPYELNCVVVECADDGAAVSARLECFERSA